MRYLVVLYTIIFFFTAGALKDARANATPAYPNVSAVQLTDLAVTVFYDYCLKTYGNGQNAMAQKVDTSLPDFIRELSLPTEQQNPFYRNESNHLWRMSTQTSGRYLWMGFKKTNDCFLSANDIDQERLIALFRTKTPDTWKSILQSVVVRSDFAPSDNDTKRGSYEVYNNGKLLYTVSVTTGLDDKANYFGLFRMEPEATD